MKLLVISDLHNSLNFATLKAKLADVPPPDLVFTLGDISVSELEVIKGSFPSCPIYSLHGNHNKKGDLDVAGIPDLHGQCILQNDVRFVGLEGSSRYKRGNYVMYSHGESLNAAHTLPRADVLLSHDRAYCGRIPNLLAEYTKDPHEGLYGIAYYLGKHAPSLHIHGHIHENKRYTHRGIDTISAYGAALVELSNMQVTRYEVLFEP